jgi:hypothetical protein
MMRNLKAKRPKRLTIQKGRLLLRTTAKQRSNLSFSFLIIHFIINAVYVSLELDLIFSGDLHFF